MKIYAISLIEDSNTVTHKADFFVIENGFVQLFRPNECGAQEVFAAFASSNVYHIVEQPAYTEEYILKQIESLNFELEWNRKYNENIHSKTV